MHQQLSRFEAFAGLDRAALLSVAQHAKLVLLPAGRWLVRRGRSLPGTYYLVRGSVRTSTPDRVIHADTSLARQAIHPGAREVRTLTPCRFLRLHPRHLECLDVLSSEPRARLADVTESDDCWQVRFLRTHLMTSLSPALWQQVLRRLAPLQLDAGDRVINEGDASNVRDCFILASGHATVTRKGRRLCELRPGDLFGEDALISARPRNASVQMVEAGQVMSLDREHFQEFLLEMLQAGEFLQPPQHALTDAGRSHLKLGSNADPRSCLASLDPCVTYFVSSPDPGICALALFLMRQQGIRAWAGACSI